MGARTGLVCFMVEVRSAGSVFATSGVIGFGRPGAGGRREVVGMGGGGLTASIR